MVEVPLDGFADALLEAVRRRPAEFPLDFARVDGVAAVMATVGLSDSFGVVIVFFMERILSDVPFGHRMCRLVGVGRHFKTVRA